MPRPTGVAHIQRITQSRRRAIKALELRSQGLTYSVLYKQCGYSNQSSAARAVSTLLKRTAFEAAEEYRKMSVLRIEALMQEVSPLVFTQVNALTGRKPPPDYQAMDRYITLQHMLYKILGLYDTRAGVSDQTGTQGDYEQSRDAILKRLTHQSFGMSRGRQFTNALEAVRGNMLSSGDSDAPVHVEGVLGETGTTAPAG